MTQSFTAHTSMSINASPQKVWDALINPAIIEQYLFGAKAESSWREGDLVTYTGEWNGMPVHDKGKLLVVSPNHELKMSYFASWSGLQDKNENYRTVTYTLQDEGDNTTTLAITQEDNISQEEADAAHQNWTHILQGLKQAVEK